MLAVRPRCEMPKCRLCLQEKDLLESHLIPAFIFRWMKQNGPTPFLRYSNELTRRVQDGLKDRWLCKDCEGLLNAYETPFSQAFHALVLNREAKIAYGAWLLKFCVSLSWRVMAFHGQDQRPELVAKAAGAVKHWAAFLRDETGSPGPYRNYFVHTFDLPESLLYFGKSRGIYVPPNLNRDCHNFTEFDVAASRSMLFVYTKTGPFATFGILIGDEKWIGADIKVKGGILAPKRYRMPESIACYLIDRASKANQLRPKMSSAQITHLEKALSDHPTRAVERRSILALDADVKMFGIDTVFGR